MIEWNLSWENSRHPPLENRGSIAANRPQFGGTATRTAQQRAAVYINSGMNCRHEHSGAI
jgi:hypothetical protein